MDVLKASRDYLSEQVALFEKQILSEPDNDTNKQAVQLLNKAIKVLNTAERGKANSRPKTVDDKLLAELRFKEGMKPAAIAKLHGVSVSAVYKASKKYENNEI